MKYSIIIPVLDEQKAINSLIRHLRKIKRIEEAEIIIVDGNSGSTTLNVIKDKKVVKLSASKGRAKQMNKGAEYAKGDILIFLHADTELPDNALIETERAIEKGHNAGAFRLKFDSQNIFMKFIALTANIRVFFTSIPYGDQAIFVKKTVFRDVGGYPDIPLMEDVELTKRISNKYGRLKIIRTPVISSARRWQRYGIFKTTAKNHYIRHLYKKGISPKELVKLYYRSMDSCSCINMFVKNPRANNAKTRLAYTIGADHAAELYRNFILDILNNLRNVDAEINIFCYPADSVSYFKKWLGTGYKYWSQSGSDIGERMRESLKICFKEGFKKAVIIGSDIPDLPRKYIDLAFESLDDNDAVIGPSDDGGYYLIGFTKSGFDNRIFTGLEWGKDQVFQGTMDVFSTTGKKVKVLQKWYDIDIYEDLKELYKRCLLDSTSCNNTKNYIKKSGIINV